MPKGESMSFISRGFKGRRRANVSSSRVPPGQHVVGDFPVLSAGPNPRVSLDQWNFTIAGEIDEPERGPWKEFSDLPPETLPPPIPSLPQRTNPHPSSTRLAPR